MVSRPNWFVVTFDFNFFLVFRKNWEEEEDRLLQEEMEKLEAMRK